MQKKLTTFLFANMNMWQPTLIIDTILNHPKVKEIFMYKINKTCKEYIYWKLQNAEERNQRRHNQTGTHISGLGIGGFNIAKIKSP